MKNSVKTICAALAGFMLGSVTVIFANQAIQAIKNTEIKVVLNGEIQEFRDETTGERQYPITYNDRTYLPLRNIAQLTGLFVDYDERTKTAILSSSKIEDNNTSSNTEETSANQTSTTKTLSERIKLYYDYVDNNKFMRESDTFIDAPIFIGWTHLVRNQNDYTLVLGMEGAKTYTEAELNKVMDDLKNNDSVVFNGYVFYKDKDMLKEHCYDTETYNELIERYSNEDGYLAVGTNDKTLYYFYKEKGETLYKVAGLSVAGAAGFIVTETKREISVTLYGDDKIRLVTNGDYDSNFIEMTVDEFYKKTETPNTTIIEDYVLYHDHLGDARDTYGSYVNAVDFIDDTILVNLKIGGV